MINTGQQVLQVEQGSVIMALLTDWQSRFDQWFRENWDHEDKAHDLAHLQRVWASAQKIMQDSAANPLVVLTA